jgi:hypothetical protein
MRKRYNEKGLDVCKVIKILEPTGNTARHFPVGRVHRLIKEETMLNTGMSVLVHQVSYIVPSYISRLTSLSFDKFTSPPSSNTSNSLVMPPVTVTTRSSATETFELAGNAVRDNKKHRR